MEHQNRRIFKGLLGHLTKAKEQLESDSGSDLYRRKRAKFQSVQRQLSEERAELAALTEEDRQRRREEEFEQRKLLWKARARRRLAVLELQIAEHESRLGDFLLTKTDPPLLWLPSDREIEGNRKIRKTLERRRKSVDERIARGGFVVEAEEQLAEEEKEIDARRMDDRRGAGQDMASVGDDGDHDDDDAEEEEGGMAEASAREENEEESDDQEDQDRKTANRRDGERKMRTGENAEGEEEEEMEMDDGSESEE